MSEIKESDWRILRNLKAEALERFCHITLAEAEHICNDSSQTYHQRYLKLFALIDRRDEALAVGFNDLRRSNALTRLVFMRASEIVTDKEYAQFSPETRARVDALLAESGLEGSGAQPGAPADGPRPAGSARR